MPISFLQEWNRFTGHCSSPSEHFSLSFQIRREVHSPSAPPGSQFWHVWPVTEILHSHIMGIGSLAEFKISCFTEASCYFGIVLPSNFLWRNEENDNKRTKVRKGDSVSDRHLLARGTDWEKGTGITTSQY